jgi:hypothetical protein
MTQKPLGKKAVFDAKKAKVANRHGKVHKQRKGVAPLLAPPIHPHPPTRPASHTCCAHAGGREFVNTKESKEDADVRTVRPASGWQRQAAPQRDTRPRPHAAVRPTQEITRLINQRNETDFARKASQSGGNLAVVRAVCGSYSRRTGDFSRPPPPDLTRPCYALVSSARLRTRPALGRASSS